MASINDIDEKRINELITEYASAGLSKNENMELEIRFRDISREVFESLYGAIKGSKEFANPVLECSVNVISKNIYEKSNSNKPDDTQYIRKMIFNGPKIMSDSYLLKTRAMKSIHVDSYIKYSIGLSRETI